jgi:hypothetical protein
MISDGLGIEPDVSTTPETPEPSAEATDGSSAAEPAADDGPARDASGRFAPRDNAAKEPAAPVARRPAGRGAAYARVEALCDQGEGPGDTARRRVHDGAGRSRRSGDARTEFQPRARSHAARAAVRGREQDFIRRETEFKAKESAPRVASPEEIEAKVVLEYLKPHLPSLLSDADLQWLQDKVKLASARSAEHRKQRDAGVHGESR